MEEVVVKRSKWGKVGKTALILCVFLVVALAGFYIWTGIPSGAATYAKNKKAAEDAGLFFTTAQLDQLNGMPRSDNAADILATTKPPKIGEQGATYADDIHKKWPQIQSGLAKLDEAATRKVVIGHLDFASGDEHGSEAMHNSASWNVDLMTLASDSSSKGDLAATKHYFRLATFLTNSLDDDHTHLGLRRRMSEMGLCCRTMAQITPRFGQKKEWRDMMIETLKAFDEPLDLRNALRVENLRLTQKMDWINSHNEWASGDPFDTPTKFVLGSRFPRFREANLSRVYEYLATTAKNLPKDPYDFDGLEKAYSAANPIFEETTWDMTFLSNVMTPSYLDVRSMRTIEASKNALLQALEILDKGLDPAKGLPLSGRYRRDADKNPLRIKHLPKGWIVYSVSADLRDDGGVEWQPGRHDFVVHLSTATVPPKPKPEAKTPSGGPPRIPAATQGDD